MAKELTAKEIELEDVKSNIEKFYERLKKNNVWGHDEAGCLAIKAEMQMLSVKTGLYARIPIYCKGENCPYDESCQALRNGFAPIGQACPTEVAQIIKKWTQYSKDFNLDDKDCSHTDEALVEELITMEIYMDRCKALMSKELSPVQMIVAGVSDNGTPLEQPALSKAAEAYEKFSKKRNEDYGLLMATRKDKSKDKKSDVTEATNITDLLDKATSMEDFYNIDQKPEGMDAVINNNKKG